MYNAAGSSANNRAKQAIDWVQSKSSDVEPAIGGRLTEIALDD